MEVYYTEYIKCLSGKTFKNLQCQIIGAVVGGGVVIIISCILSLQTSVSSTCAPQSEPSMIASITQIATNMPTISHTHQYLLQQSQSSRGPYKCNF